MVNEKTIRPRSGWIPLLVWLTVLLGVPLLFVFGVIGAISPPSQTVAPFLVIGIFLTIVLEIVAIFGFQAVPPNNARVL